MSVFSKISLSMIANKIFILKEGASFLTAIGVEYYWRTPPTNYNLVLQNLSRSWNSLRKCLFLKHLHMYSASIVMSATIFFFFACELMLYSTIWNHIQNTIFNQKSANLHQHILSFIIFGSFQSAVPFRYLRSYFADVQWILE